jgi:hypothetical protein
MKVKELIKSLEHFDEQEDMNNGYDVVDVEWFATEQERDQSFKENQDDT